MHIFHTACGEKKCLLWTDWLTHFMDQVDRESYYTEVVDDKDSFQVQRFAVLHYSRSKWCDKENVQHNDHRLWEWRWHKEPVLCPMVCQKMHTEEQRQRHWIDRCSKIALNTKTHQHFEKTPYKWVQRRTWYDRSPFFQTGFCKGKWERNRINCGKKLAWQQFSNNHQWKWAKTALRLVNLL